MTIIIASAIYLVISYGCGRWLKYIEKAEMGGTWQKELSELPPVGYMTMSLGWPFILVSIVFYNLAEFLFGD